MPLLPRKFGGGGGGGGMDYFLLAIANVSGAGI